METELEAVKRFIREVAEQEYENDKLLLKANLDMKDKIGRGC